MGTVFFRNWGPTAGNSSCRPLELSLWFQTPSLWSRHLRENFWYWNWGKTPSYETLPLQAVIVETSIHDILLLASARLFDHSCIPLSPNLPCAWVMFVLYLSCRTSLVWEAVEMPSCCPNRFKETRGYDMMTDAIYHWLAINRWLSGQYEWSSFPSRDIYRLGASTWCIG